NHDRLKETHAATPPPVELRADARADRSTMGSQQLDDGKLSEQMSRRAYVLIGPSIASGSTHGALMTNELFSDLRTLPDVNRFVYRLLAEWQEQQLLRRGLGEPFELPLELDELGPLMVRAVEIAGPDGLTRQALFELFDPLGEDRTQRGI